MNESSDFAGTKVWAHRGWSGKYPENTIPAFKAALSLGVDGIEFDVHLTRDGKIVVLHDARLERTTNGMGPVSNYTLAEIKALDAGSWFHPTYIGTPIPTLAEVLILIGQHPTPVDINIEIKVGDAPYQDLEELVWQQVCDFGLMEQTIISSFHHGVLRKLKTNYKDANVGLLYRSPADMIHEAIYFDAKAIHPRHTTITPPLVAMMHQHGIKVNAWTANRPRDIVRVRRMNVDAVITNHPDLFQQIARMEAKRAMQAGTMGPPAARLTGR